MSNKNVVSVRGKKKIVLAAGNESMGSKGKRGILFSGLVVVVAFFMVWAGAAIGSMISPPNQIVLQNQSIAQYVYTNNSSAIPFANVNGQIEYPMPTGQHVSYIETNATLAELNSRDAGKITLNLSQPGSSPSLSYAPSLIHGNLVANYPMINFTETGLPAGAKWGVVDYLGGIHAVAISNTSYLEIEASSAVIGPQPFEIFPQSANPNSDMIYASGSVPATVVHIVFHAPQPSYYIYSLSKHGTVTVSKLHTTDSYYLDNYTGKATLTNISLITVGSNPVAMQTLGAYTYVVNYGSSNLSVIKGTKLFKTISLPSGAEPNAMNIFNGTIYVTGNGTNSLYLIGLTNMTLYRTIAFTKGINPVGLIVQSASVPNTLSGKNQTMAFVAIANGTGNGTLAVVTFIGSSYTVSYYSLYTPNPTSMMLNSFASQYETSSVTKDDIFALEISFPTTVSTVEFATNLSNPIFAFDNVSLSSNIKNFRLLPAPYFSAEVFKERLRDGEPGPLIAKPEMGILAVNATESVMLSYNYPDYTLEAPGISFGGLVIPPYNSFLALPNGLTIVAENNGLNFTSQAMGNTTFHPWDPVALTDSVIENYSITFNEAHLPKNVNWTVTVGNITQTSNTTSMTFYGSNGTYSYSAKFVNYSGSSGIIGYIPFSNGTGTIVINGTSISRTIGYEPERTFGVTFTETGLPSNTSWSISLNGAVKNSTASAISFSEPNGTYEYSIGAVTGYTTSSAGGSVIVNGSSAQVNITFSPLVVMPTQITIGYGTSPANFVPLAYATVNGSTVSFTIQPQYLTGNQSKYLMIRISSSGTSIDLRDVIYGNSGISTYFGPITGEEIGYWLGAVMIFGGAFMAMPWHDFRLKRGVKQ
jgi:hypothetical protein